MKVIAKRFLIVLLSLSFLAVAPLLPVKAEENHDWVTLSGKMTATDADDGFTELSGITVPSASGDRIAYAYKLHLDGATIQMRDVNAMDVGDFFGFYLAKERSDPFPESRGTTGFVVDFRKGFNGGSLNTTQTRLSISTGHDIHNSIVAIYESYESMLAEGTKRFGGPGTLVTNCKDEWGVSLRFTRMELSEGTGKEKLYWKIEITQLYPDLIWGKSYNTGFDGKDTCTVYMWNSTVSSKLDENGDTNVIFFGTDNGTGSQAVPKRTTPPAAQVKLDDLNKQSYDAQKDGLLSAATSALSSYRSAVESMEDYLDYLTCRDLRTAAESAVSRLRGEDRAELDRELADCNRLLEEKGIPTLADTEWIDAGGSTTGGSVSDEERVTATFDPSSRFSTLSNLTQWGRRAYFAYKVHLDGATITLRDEGGTSEDNDFWGFILSPDPDGYFSSSQSPFAGVFWKGLYDNGKQTRFHIGKDHNYGNESLVWPTKDFTLGSYPSNFGVDKSLVLTDADNYGLSVRFDYMKDASNPEGGYWKLTVAELYADQMWRGSNTANYDSETRTSTVYVRPSDLSKVLDRNGDVYVIAGGDASNRSRLQYKIDDRYYSEYAQDELITLSEAVEEYGRQAEAVKGDDFSAFLDDRDRLLEELGGLRGNDASLLTMRLYKYDAALAANADVQSHLMNLLDESYQKTETAVKALESEDKLSEEPIEKAQALLDGAKEVFDVYEGMLSDSNRKTMTDRTASLQYAINRSKAVLWLLRFETGTNELSSLSGDALVERMVQLQQYRMAYAGSEAERLAQALTGEDKSEYERRLQAADSAFGAAYSQNETKVKESYLSDWEELLLRDLTSKQNLDAALDGYLTLSKYVEITEADASLYARYTAAYRSFADASGAYLKQATDILNAYLDENIYTTLEEFAPIKASYLNLDERYLEYCDAAIKDAFERMSARMIDQNLFYFSVTSDSAYRFLNTDSGIYFEHTPRWPNRFNFDKKLDLREGIELTLTMEEYATLETQYSNNLFLNFLEEPASYKGDCEGISLILWFSNDSDVSYVRVYNYTDVEIAYIAFRTPTEGVPFTLSVRYGDYTDYDGTQYEALVIDVNHGESLLALTEEEITANGHTLPKEVYFSAGMACNIFTYRDAVTLNAIRCGDYQKSFALKTYPDLPELPSEDPEPTDPDPTDPDPTDPDPTDPEPSKPEPTDPEPSNPDPSGPEPTDPGKEEKKGCLSTIGASGALLACGIAVAAAVLLKKTKKGGVHHEK